MFWSIDLGAKAIYRGYKITIKQLWIQQQNKYTSQASYPMQCTYIYTYVVIIMHINLQSDNSIIIALHSTMDISISFIVFVFIN